MLEKTAHYFFEYDRPPSPKTGRPRKPGRTTWRMTIEYAKANYGEEYRPILETVEYRTSPGDPGLLRFGKVDRFSGGGQSDK